MTQKHTPGPWVLGPMECVWPEAHVELINGLWAAKADSPQIIHSYGRSERDGVANARLIAAAPDLLEALKALRLQALQSSVNDAANEWGMEALALAHAAIAKAEGGEA